MADQNLSINDVKKLLEDPSGEHRAEMAEKIGQKFSDGVLTPEERAIAEEIFRAMVKDVEVRVRSALSESLKENPELSHDIALNLANDVEEVSLPFIECSEVLTDQDLIEIIKNSGEEAQSAVARRKTVSENVSEALVETNEESVVATLVSNDGAKLSEKSMEKVLDNFGDVPLISGQMAVRKKVPLKVAERLVTMVSEGIREHLVTHHEITPDMAMDIVISSREMATVGLLDPSSTNRLDLLGLIDQLQANGRLTPTIILRALCMGDAAFFEAALAKKAGVPVMNVYKLIHDKGGLGLDRLFERCEMPQQTRPIAKAALELLEEYTITSGDDRNSFRQIMIERVLTKVEDAIEGDNLNYLIGKLGSKSNQVAA